MNQSRFVKHVSCKLCHSSDGAALYSDGNIYCHKCNTLVYKEGKFKTPKRNVIYYARAKKMNEIKGKFGVPERGLSEETCKKYNYVINEHGNHVMHYYNSNRECIALKFRTPDKKFSWTGEARMATLFGQQIFNNNTNKSLIITEGEIDALSAYQMSGIASVSIPNGAQSAEKEIAKNLEFVNSFTKIYLCFDTDKEGNKALNKVAPMLPVGKTFIIKLPEKDANKMLELGKRDEFRDCIANAKRWESESFLSKDNILDILNKEDEKHAFTFDESWSGLNEMIPSIPFGALCIIIAGTGIGKSVFVREIHKRCLDLRLPSAGFYLEEPLKENILNFIGIMSDHPVEEVMKLEKEEKTHYLNKLLDPVSDEGHRLFNLYASAEAITFEDIMSKIRYIVACEGVKVVFIDHLTYITDRMSSVNQAQEISRMMITLNDLAKELNILIFAPCQMKSINGDNRVKEGYIPSEDDIKGSSTIKQVANKTISIGRNALSKNIIKRNTINIVIHKNRGRSIIGECSPIYYNVNTGRIQGDCPYETYN